MNMISEQINYLRGYITSDENLYDALHEAADTIESLSAKLDELAVRLMVQENLRSGEMAMKGLLDGFGLNADIEASSAKLADKERSAEDCGCGWIPCKEKLPEEGKEILLQDHYGNIEIVKFGHNAFYQDGFYNGDWFSTANNYLAWRSLPDPYHEP